MNGMNGYKKEEVKRDMCKNHSARPERDIYRVCPSKLTKKELEDLYFTLLDKNLELKKAATTQQDQIKVLSTKLQRMTATQKNNVAKEKDCCTYTKSMVNEQKENIAELKKANERMSERIRVLNMRLCSAKQFLRQGPATSTSRCTKCSAPPASLKNSSVTVLHTKMSGSNANTGMSGPGIDKDVMLSTRTVETETDQPEKENPERLCNENRCRSLMEELKQKIVDLQEELSKTHSEYSTRITRLETEVSELRTANERERTERATSDHQLQMRDQQAELLVTRLRDAEAKYGELTTKLSIEKRIVAELETRVKAADRASVVSKTLQEHFNNNNQKKTEVDVQQSETAGSPCFSPRWDKSSSPEQKKTEVDVQQSEPAGSPCFSPRWDKSSSPRQDIPCVTPCQPSEASDKPCTDKDISTEKTDHRLSKVSNDSGYIEANKSPKTKEEKQKEANEELTNKIAELQKQMNEFLTANKSNPVAFKEDDEAQCYSRSIPIQVTVFPGSESEEGKTLESKIEPRPEKCRDDMMTFLDAVSTTDQAANIDMNKAERESFENKDTTPLHEETTSLSKNDTHNRLQIPGPLPVGNICKAPEKFCYKHKFVKCTMRGKDCLVKESEVNKQEGFNVKNDNAVEKPFSIHDEVKTKRPSRDFKDKTPGDNGVEVERDTKVRIRSARNSSDSAAKVPANVGGLTEKYIESEVDRGPTTSTMIPVISAQTDDGNNIELCLHHTRVCTCGGARRRDVSVFRTCSGTLRFRTAPAHSGPTFKRCACASSNVSGDVAVTCEQATQTTETQAPVHQLGWRSTVFSMRQTYPIPAPVGNTQQASDVRASTPDNTDHEISSLSDLPSEKDDKSPRAALSPGEEKATTTYTDSYTPHTTTDSTLSEGELPGAGGARKLSVGETKLDFKETQAGSGKYQSGRMEEALASITEDLALCRHMLRERRASEVTRPVNK